MKHGFFTRRPRRSVLNVSMAVGVMISFDARGDVWAQTASPAISGMPVDPLQSPVAGIRRKAASDLGKSKAPDALPRLAALVRDPDVDVRLTVLRAIASLRDLTGVPSMVVFMGDAQAKVRSEAIDGVVEIYTHRDRPGVSRFLSVFSDGRDKPEPLVVTAVDFEVYRSLAGLLKDSDASVRESAAEAIGILGGTEVAVDLVQALRDSVPNVRAATVTAIVKVGTSADGESLTPLLADGSSNVRRRAMAGLGRLRVVDSAPNLRAAFQAAPDSDDGILALTSLAQLALAQDLPMFKRFILQREPRRRRASVEGLARLADTTSEARFKRDFQRENDEAVRDAYAFAIFSLGDGAFIDTVILGLAGSRDLARQSRGYLEELGAKMLPDALEYLTERDPRIRAGLCEAFANAGVTAALPHIQPLTKEKDQLVASAANRAIAILSRQR